MCTDADSTYGSTEKRPQGHGTRPKPTSGFVILRFEDGFLPDYSETFIEAIRKADRRVLLHATGDLWKLVRRVVESVKPEELQRFEAKAKETLGGKFLSLSRFWRIDGRKAATSLGELEAEVRRWPGVDLTWA